jgi:uncharacterized membrane protein
MTTADEVAEDRPPVTGGGDGAGREGAPSAATTPLPARVLRAVGRHPARVTFVVVVVVGLAYALLTPPLTGTDERDHFTRAYALSSGQLLVEQQGDEFGFQLPTTYTERLDRIRGSYFRPDRTAFLDHLGDPAPDGPDTFVEGGLTAAYAPVPYLPYVVPAALGRWFGLSLELTLYLCRVAGVLAYAALLSLAVRRMPTHRWVIAIGGMLPVAVFQASVVSADGMVTALTLLVAALALRLSIDDELSFDRGGRGRRVLVEAGIAAMALAWTKPPYMAMVLLLIIPAVRHRRRLAIPLGAIVVAAFVLTAVWGSYQSANARPLNDPGMVQPGADTYAFHGVDPGAQADRLLSHPFDFVGVLRETFAHMGWQLPRDLFGSLSLYQASLGVVLGAVALLALSCVARDGRRDLRLPVPERVVLGGLAVVSAIGVLGIMYLRVNEVGAPRIDGWYPRYFVPLLPLLLVAVLPSGWPRGVLRSPAVGGVLAGLLVVLQVVAVAGLVDYHFGAAGGLVGSGDDTTAATTAPPATAAGDAPAP